jgi:cystathionine beta-lyase
VRRAIEEAVAREDFGYVEADLSPLTGACAAFQLAQYGWQVSEARIFPVADVLVGLAAAFAMHVPAGRPIVVPTPAYPPFFEIIELAGREPIPVPLLDNTLDIDAIDRAFVSGAGAILLCNPHNPTGRVFTTGELGALADVVDRHGARVVADEVHAPLVFPGSRHVPYASLSDLTAAHAITVTSASKAFNLAGLKCAQVIASNHDDATRWRTRGVFEVPGPTPIGIAASVAAYRDGGPWLHDLVAYLDGNRRRLAELLADRMPAVGCRIPEATFLAWLDCAALGHVDPARFFLERAGVAVSDGPPFGPGCDQQVRLNFATSRALLDRIVGAMAAA